VVVEEKVYVAEPLESEIVGDCVAPSTLIVIDPVGEVVTDVEAEDTLIVMVSLAPEAGVLVAADSVVVEGVKDDEDATGQAASKL
jgi:hypothetical protein